MHSPVTLDTKNTGHTLLHIKQYTRRKFSLIGIAIMGRLRISGVSQEVMRMQGEKHKRVELACWGEGGERVEGEETCQRLQSFGKPFEDQHQNEQRLESFWSPEP
jgi:hypothetical protein